MDRRPLTGAVLVATDASPITSRFRGWARRAACVCWMEGEDLFNDATAIVDLRYLHVCRDASGRGHLILPTPRWFDRSVLPAAYSSGLLVGLGTCWCRGCSTTSIQQALVTDLSLYRLP